MYLFNYQKAVEVINFFATKENGSIDKLKCIKLVWLADRLHFIRYGRTITFDSYYAMEKGPVPSGIKDLIDGSSFLSDKEKSYRNNKIKKTGNKILSISPINDEYFSETDINTLNEIYDSFKDKNGLELSKFSHKFPEWLNYKNKLKSTTRVEINILDFLKPLNRKNKDLNMFKKNNKWLELLTEMHTENESIPFRSV